MQPRRVVLIWFSIVLTSLIAFPFLTLLILNREDSTEVFWIHQLQVRKQRIADNEHRPGRLLIVGGSGALYGIDATVLEARLGIPCINLATHAGLGLRHHLVTAKRSARPGDTVLLAAEYHLYFMREETLNDQQWGYYFTHDPAYLLGMPLRQSSRLLLLAPPSAYIDSISRITDLISGKFEQSRYRVQQDRSAAYLSPRGDLQLFQATPKAVAPPRAEVYSSGEFPPETIDALKEFADWCAQQGTRLIVAAPNALVPAEGRADLVRVTERLHQNLTRLNIEGVFEPDEQGFSAPFFFDTFYHLNPTGRRIRSELLARRLSFLRCPASADSTEQPEKRGPLVVLSGWREPGLQPDEWLDWTRADYRLWADAKSSHPSEVDLGQVQDALYQGRSVFALSDDAAARLSSAGFQCYPERKCELHMEELIENSVDCILYFAISAGEAHRANWDANVPDLFRRHDDIARVGYLGTGKYSAWRHLNADPTNARFETMDRGQISNGLLPVYTLLTSTAGTDRSSHRMMIQLERLKTVMERDGCLVAVYEPDLQLIRGLYLFRSGTSVQGELFRVEMRNE